MLMQTGKAADGETSLYLHVGFEHTLLVRAVEFNRLYGLYQQSLKDAERYRILREQGDFGCTEKDGFGGRTLKMGFDLDTAVDAQISENKGE